MCNVVTSGKRVDDMSADPCDLKVCTNAGASDVTESLSSCLTVTTYFVLWSYTNNVVGIFAATVEAGHYPVTDAREDRWRSLETGFVVSVGLRMFPGGLASSG